MKFGYFHFSYANFKPFAERMTRDGFYTINLGDYMQILAVKSLYAQLGVEPAEMIPIDRDTLSSYDGPPAILPMNACLYDWCFPLPENIVPVFIGFQAKKAVVAAQIEHLRPYQPIGCRDRATAEALEKRGVAAEVTGCLTLAFPPREIEPELKTNFIVYGSGAGAFPSEALAGAPPAFWERTEFVSQRTAVGLLPLGPSEMARAELQASAMLRDYRERATLVVTPLHHAAAPCMASGIPVILCRSREDPRFSYLREVLPVHLPGEFENIGWSPEAIDLSAIRDRLKRRLADALFGATGDKRFDLT